MIKAMGSLLASVLAGGFTLATTTRSTTDFVAPPVVHARLLIRAPNSYHELAIGTVVPLRDVASIAFSTPDIGYALGGPIGYTYPLKTTDSGRSWQVDGPAFFLPIADAASSVSQLATASSSEAFAYGGPGDGSAVDITTDGGHQWWNAYLGQGLMAMAVRGSDLWALAAGSSPSSESDAVPTVWLYNSTDGGRIWTYESSLDGVLGWEADLARPNTSTGFALVKAYRNDAPQDEHLVATSDGGLRWKTRVDPCNRTFFGYAVDWSERLIASSATSLWMFCGSQPATGTQIKLVERSTNGGQTWTLVASDAPSEHVPPNDIPFSGELPDSGTTGYLSVESQSNAWLILIGDNVLWRTSNGGRNWTAAAPASVEQQFPQQLSETGRVIVVRTQNALWVEMHNAWKLIAGSPEPY